MSPIRETASAKHRAIAAACREWPDPQFEVQGSIPARLLTLCQPGAQYRFLSFC